MIDEHAIGERYRALAGELNERQRRLWAGAEAISHGPGGQAAVIRATGLAAMRVAGGMVKARRVVLVDPRPTLRGPADRSPV